MAGADGPDDLEVVVAVEARVDAALETDLGGARASSASRTRSVMSDELEEIGRAPEVEREGALGEGAEAALEGADVGVVDVAVGHPGDDVAHGLGPQLVGQLGHGPDLGPAGAEEGDDLVLVEVLARG